MRDTEFNIQNIEGDFNNIESPEKSVDSIINVVINEISGVKVSKKPTNRSFPPKTQKKIEHNMLKSQRRIVLQYKEFSSHIERAYSLAEKNIVNGKDNAMFMLNEMYCKSLDKYGIDSFEPDILDVRKHADDIVLDVIRQLKKFLYNSANVMIYKEQIERGVNVVVAHAFVECHVLENINASNQR